MELWKKIVDEEGEDVLNLVLMVYANFYLAELDVVELCARWIPKRQDIEEKFLLVEHAYDEMRHAKFFKGGIKRLGLNFEDIDLQKYQLDDRSARFNKLLSSDDELAVLVGLNLYAEGTHATQEMIDLYANKPEYFPVFSKTIPDEERHVNFGRIVLMRRITESPDARRRAQHYSEEWMRHMQQYLWTDVSDAINIGIHLGYLSPDYRMRVARRFQDVMTSVGLTVNWPATGPLSALRNEAAPAAQGV
jgi:1,2-phenylacetyl-CoA epoxidase catalytic subunit